MPEIRDIKKKIIIKALRVIFADNKIPSLVISNIKNENITSPGILKGRVIHINIKKPVTGKSLFRVREKVGLDKINKIKDIKSKKNKVENKE